LLSFVRDEECDRFFDVIQGKPLQFTWNISLFTAIQENYYACVFSAFTESFIVLFCERSDISFLSLFV
jgi:hypothetical protein